MWTSIIVTMLPLLSPVIKWGIDKFISNQEKKLQLLAQFEAFIALHKSDGALSAKEHDDYKNQIDSLKKENKDGSSADSKGIQG